MSNSNKDNFCKDVSIKDFYEYDYKVRGMSINYTEAGIKKIETEIEFAIKNDKLIKLACEYGFDMVGAIHLCYGMAHDEDTQGFPDKWTEEQIREQFERLKRFNDIFKKR